MKDAVDNLAPAAPGDVPAGRPGRLWVRLMKGAMFAAVMFLVVRELVGRLAVLTWPADGLGTGWLAGALGVYLCGIGIFSVILHKSLARFARPPAWRVVAAVAWVARLGKYVPGKVASVAGATWLLSRRGVPVRAAISGLFLHQGLWIVLCFLAAVPLTLWRPVQEALPLAWAWFAAGIVAGVACLHPRVFLWIEGLMLRRLGRPAETPQVSLRGLWPPALLQAVNIVSAGLTTWLICRAVTPIDLSALPMVISATAMAAVSGFLAVFAPAGLGVREGILLYLLGPLVGHGPSAVVVLLARAMQTVVELLLAGAGLIILRRNPPRVAGEGEGPGA